MQSDALSAAPESERPARQDINSDHVTNAHAGSVRNQPRNDWITDAVDPHVHEQIGTKVLRMRNGARQYAAARIDKPRRFRTKRQLDRVGAAPGRVDAERRSVEMKAARVIQTSFDHIDFRRADEFRDAQI